MIPITDRQLLQQYAETGSNDAFAELVARHNNWIYSAARRVVRRCDWAQDVTQAVFLVLAKQAKTLKLATLDGWLFKVTRYCAANLLREENRRKNRERQAAAMNSETREPASDSIWEDIAPILEQSVGRLRALDRDAVLLRFYQKKNMSEVGSALGISEDAARKRVAKALDSLRSLMSARQVTLPSADVAITLLSRHATQTAPPQLGASCLPGAATTTASRIAHGVSQMLFAFKLKLAILAIATIAIIPTGLWMGLHASSSTVVAVQPTVQNPAPQIPLPATQPDPDLSTPYRTVASMFAALKAGDHDRLYRCLLINPGKEPSILFRAMDFDLAASRMMNATTSAFGHAADSITRRDDALGQIAVAIWSDGPGGAKCVIDNDTAQLQAQITPKLLSALPPNVRSLASQWSGAPLYFEKQSDGWKLDMDRSCRLVMRTGVDAATPEDQALMNAGVLQELANYCDQVATDIHSGRLATVSQTAKEMGNAQKILKQYGMTRLETTVLPASPTTRP